MAAEPQVQIGPGSVVGRGCQKLVVAGTARTGHALNVVNAAETGVPVHTSRRGMPTTHLTQNLGLKALPKPFDIPQDALAILGLSRAINLVPT